MLHMKVPDHLQFKHHIMPFDFEFKGRVMGPLLALVCPCFRKNVIVTCKIAYFLCNLDNFLLKNVIVFIFGKQLLKWRSSEKKMLFFLLLFTFFSHQGKDTKIPYFTHISAHTCI